MDIFETTGVRPRLSIEAIADHPRMAEARQAYLAAFLKIYEGDPFLIRLLIESSRILMYLVISVLEAGYDPDRRETWVTIGLLKKTMATFGLASDRTIDALVARLVSVGYLESRVAPQDGRVRLLTPTEVFRQHDRDWIAAHYVPLQVLHPEHDYTPALRCDPTFHGAYRRASLPFLPLGAQLYGSLTDMRPFLDRPAGYMVVAALFHRAMEQGDDPAAHVAYRDLGDRFGISHSHVRSLILSAEQADLVRIHRGENTVEILPRFWRAHDRGLATGMYLHDLAFQATARPAG